MPNDVVIGIKLKADGSGLVRATQLSSRELRKLESRFDRTARSGQKLAASSKGIIGSLTSVRGIISTLAGTALVGAIGRTLEYADQIDKLSTRIGASTEALSEYAHVADLAGVRFNALTIGWQRMARRISEGAAGTGEAVNALDELGLSATKLNQLRPEQQFQVLSEALRGVESEADRVRLAFKFWDSEGVQLLQIVNQTSEAIAEQQDQARQLGKSLSEDQVQAMVKAKDSLTNLKAAFEGLFLTAVNFVGPALAEVAGWLSEHIPKAASIMGAAITAARGVFVSAFGVMLNLLGKWYNLFGKIPGAWGEEWRRIGGELESAAAQANDLGQVYLDQIAGMISGGEEFNVVLGRTVLGLEAFKTEQKNSRVEQEKARRETEKATKAQKDFLDSIFPADAALDKMNEDLNTLTKLYQDGTISLLKYEEGVRAITEAYLDLDKPLKEAAEKTKEVKEAADPIAEVYEEAARSIYGGVRDAARSLLDGPDGLKGIGAKAKAWLKDLVADLVAIAALKPIVIPVVTAVGGALGVSQSAQAQVLGQLGAGGAQGGAPGGGFSPSSLIGGNSIGSAFQGVGDFLFSNTSLPVGNLMEAGAIPNWQFGVASLLGGFLGQKVFGGHGGLGGGAGAAAGFAFGGPVGAILGGLGGGFLGGLFGKEKIPKAKLGTFADTSQIEDAHRGAFAKGAYGYVGFADDGSKNLRAQEFTDFFKGVASLDNTIASFLSEEMNEQVKNALQGFVGKSQKEDIEPFKFLQERLGVAFDAINADLAALIRNFEGADTELENYAISLAALHGFIESNPIDDFKASLEDAGRTLYDIGRRQADEVRRLAAAFDGSAESASELAAATQRRYATEQQLLAAYTSANNAILTGLGGLSESISLDLMDPGEQFEYFREQALGLADSLRTMIDPQEIQATTTAIQNYTSRAWSVLTPEQRQQMGGDFLDFITDVMGVGQERIGFGVDEVGAEGASLRTTVQERLVSVSQDQVAAVEKNTGAVETLTNEVRQLSAKMEQANGYYSYAEVG